MKKIYLKLTLLLLLAVCSIPNTWAERGWFSTGMWQIWGWKTGYGGSGYIKRDDGNLFNSDEDYNLGVLTESSSEYWFGGVGAKTYGTEVDGVKCYYALPGGAQGNQSLGTNDSGNNRYWEHKTLYGNDGYSVNKSADPGDYAIHLYFKIVAGGNEYSENHRQIKWTIPGFKTDNPTSFDFGSNNPVGRKNVAKIGVVHYGDWPTLGGCALSGTNASDFEVIDIDYTGVTVVFTPSSADSKSATLTITDTYSKQWTVTLSGTGAANTTTTRLYFNDYNYHSAWSDKSAQYRFSCEYTSGIYTYYNMTRCTSSAYNYYADVEIKTGSIHIDRAKPESPYTTWNSFTPGLSSSDRYAVIDNYENPNYFGFATNHPYMDVTGGNIYYDNSKSGLTNTLYLVIGHDYKMSNSGVADEHSTPYALANITNTKLYYRAHSDAWHKADYYAFIGSSSSPSDGEWGSDDLSTKASSSSYTGIYRDIMDLESGSSYLGYAATKTNGALSMTKSPTLNTTQTFNYAISTDGGTGYTVMKSGDPNTPGQLEMTAFEFTSAACTAVTVKDDEELTLSANGTTYTSSVSYVAYTGTTTLEASDLRDGYTFVGWYNGNTRRTTDESFTYYPQGDSTFTARYKANTFTVTFNANYPSGAVNNGASMADQDFVYEVAENLTANTFACEGYTFTGWKKGNATSGEDVSDEADGCTLTNEDGGEVTLFAQWSDDGTYYYKGASADGWGTAANWTRNAVPGSTDDVIVLTELNAPSGTTTVNSVRIATSGTYTPVGGSGITANGSLTIPSGTALKVVTNIQNCEISDNAPSSTSSTTSSTLEIAAGGALVWGGGGSPGDARVGFHTVSGGVPGSKEAVNEYIGIPFTSLSSDAYYNAWVFQVSGETWAEVNGATLAPWTGYNIIEKKEVSGTTGGSYSLTGELVSSSASLGSGATAGSETLYANSWVAPIEISKIGYDGTGTIYMFRPSSLKNLEDEGLEGNPQGNYSSITINEAVGQYIRSMQSFSVWSGTTISINYATAVYGEIAAGKNAPRRERTTDYRQAIWDTQDSLFVYVQSASGWGDELKMFIHNDFSQNYENGWDGPKMEGMWEAPKLYTVNNEGEMAVSCVPTAENSVIAFHAGTASNEYTFTFKYSGEDELVLKDTKTGIETPIVDGGTYEFTSNKGDDDMRFVIKKVPAVVTGVDNISDNASGVQKIMFNGTMYIVRDGRIYDATGALVK